MRIHELELFAADPKASREFYKNVVGLELDEAHSNDGLNIFNVPGMDFNTSVHNPGRTGVSFVVEDIAPLIARLRDQGIEFTPPEKDHTGMPMISLNDPDGNVVRVHGKAPLPDTNG